MDLEHDRERLRIIAVKNVLQNKNNKFHRREIVVMEEDFIELWFFELGLALGHYLAAAVYVGKLWHINIILTTEHTETTEKVKCPFL